MIAAARTPGCSLWLCQVDTDLAAALAEIRRLDKMVAETEAKHGTTRRRRNDRLLVDHQPHQGRQMALDW
jgi:hypothetical protein